MTTIDSARASERSSLDAHYAAYDRMLAGDGASAVVAGQKPVLACPPPKAFSAAQEIFWLAVVASQLGWLWPPSIARRLSAVGDGCVFTVDQLRYLLRRDDKVTALEAAAAGVRLESHRRDLAERLLDQIRTTQGTVTDDPRYGRWPQPPESETVTWEAEKNAFFAMQPAGKALTAEEEVAWVCLLFAQMGWPMPALITRIFPPDWVSRQLDPSFVTTLFGPKDDVDIVDAILCGAKVRKLDLKMIEAAWRLHEEFIREREEAAKQGHELRAPIIYRIKPRVALAEQELILAMFDAAQDNLERRNELPRLRISLEEFIVKRRVVFGGGGRVSNSRLPNSRGADRVAAGSHAALPPGTEDNGAAPKSDVADRPSTENSQTPQAAISPAVLAGMKAQQAAMKRWQAPAGEAERGLAGPVAGDAAPAERPKATIPEPHAERKNEQVAPIAPVKHVNEFKATGLGERLGVQVALQTVPVITPRKTFLVPKIAPGPGIIAATPEDDAKDREAVLDDVVEPGEDHNVAPGKGLGDMMFDAVPDPGGTGALAPDAIRGDGRVGTAVGVADATRNAVTALPAVLPSCEASLERSLFRACSDEIASGGSGAGGQSRDPTDAAAEHSGVGEAITTAEWFGSSGAVAGEKSAHEDGEKLAAETDMFHKPALDEDQLREAANLRVGRLGQQEVVVTAEPSLVPVEVGQAHPADEDGEMTSFKNLPSAFPHGRRSREGSIDPDDVPAGETGQPAILIGERLDTGGPGANSSEHVNEMRGRGPNDHYSASEIAAQTGTLPPSTTGRNVQSVEPIATSRDLNAPNAMTSPTEVESESGDEASALANGEADARNSEPKTTAPNSQPGLLGTDAERPKSNGSDHPNASNGAFHATVAQPKSVEQPTVVEVQRLEIKRHN
jgi:hypothetical protein